MGTEGSKWIIVKFWSCTILYDFVWICYNCFIQYVHWRWKLKCTVYLPNNKWYLHPCTSLIIGITYTYCHDIVDLWWNTIVMLCKIHYVWLSPRIIKLSGLIIMDNQDNVIVCHNDHQNGKMFFTNLKLSIIWCNTNSISS